MEPSGRSEDRRSCSPLLRPRGNAWVDHCGGDRLRHSVGRFHGYGFAGRVGHPFRISNRYWHCSRTQGLSGLSGVDGWRPQSWRSPIRRPLVADERGPSERARHPKRHGDRHPGRVARDDPAADDDSAGGTENTSGHSTAAPSSAEGDAASSTSAGSTAISAAPDAESVPDPLPQESATPSTAAPRDPG